MASPLAATLDPNVPPAPGSARAKPPRRLPASLDASSSAGRPRQAEPRVRKLPKFRDETEHPLLRLPPGLVHCRHAGEADEHCAELLRRHAAGALGALGFDIEWPVAFVTGQPPLPVATVQLATRADVYVFQVGQPALPPRLRELLEDRSIPKAGVGISNDGLKLRRDFGVRCGGLLDLSQLAARTLPDGARPWCLAELAERVLRRRLLKSSELRTGSNWAAPTLSPEQVEYAALDAWAGRQICAVLLQRAAAAAASATAAAAAAVPTADELLATLLFDTPPPPPPLPPPPPPLPSPAQTPLTTPAATLAVTIEPASTANGVCCVCGDGLGEVEGDVNAAALCSACAQLDLGQW